MNARRDEKLRLGRLREMSVGYYGVKPAPERQAGRTVAADLSAPTRCSGIKPDNPRHGSHDNRIARHRNG